MTTLEIILTVTIYVLITIEFVMYFVLMRIVKRYKELQNAYKDRLDYLDKGMNEVLNYCLKSVFNIAVKDEDYITAKRCKELLEKLNSNQHP